MASSLRTKSLSSKCDVWMRNSQVHCLCLAMAWRHTWECSQHARDLENTHWNEGKGGGDTFCTFSISTLICIDPVAHPLVLRTSGSTVPQVSSWGRESSQTTVSLYILPSSRVTGDGRCPCRFTEADTFNPCPGQLGKHYSSSLIAKSIIRWSSSQGPTVSRKWPNEYTQALPI